MKITDFCEIRGISWNFMEIHRIPWKCVKSVISVEFQISSGTHLRNTKESLRLSRVLASGPGRLDLHKNHEEVQNSKKKYAAPTENTKDILSFLFSWRFSPFRLQCEKPWYSYRIIEVSAVPFPAKSSFSWKSWFPVKITGFHRKPRFSRKCWFRRKARLENTKKWLR